MAASGRHIAVALAAAMDISVDLREGGGLVDPSSLVLFLSGSGSGACVCENKCGNCLAQNVWQSINGRP